MTKTITSRLRVDVGDFIIFVDATGEPHDHGVDLISLELVEVDHQLHDVDPEFARQFEKTLLAMAESSIDRGDFEEIAGV